MKKFILISILLISILALGLGAGVYYYLYLMPPPLMKSPLAESTQLSFEPQYSDQYVVLGFLPYWLINKEEHFKYPFITDVAYFGIEFDEKGELMTNLDDGTKELGLHRLKGEDVGTILQKAQQSGNNTTLVVKILNNPGIEAAISPVNRDDVIQEILEIREQYDFDNVNIDFEYIGSPTQDIRQGYADFIRLLNITLKDDCLNCVVSIDVYADAGLKEDQRLWDLDLLADNLDYVIVMGYDFHRPSSPQAGPVAPLRNDSNRWNDDLSTALRAILEKIPAEKVILGVPYYGYEWQTRTPRLNAMTIPQTSRLASFTRVQELFSECESKQWYNPQLEELTEGVCYTYFDYEAMSPVLIFGDEDSFHQIWYEDVESLSYKYQLVKDLNLAGIAIWALGYDAEHLDFWNLLREEF